MSLTTFSELLVELCNVAGLKEAGRVVHGSGIAIEGIPFSFDHSATPEWERIFVYCDFGALPDTRRELVCQRLLNANLALCEERKDAGMSYSTFTMSSEDEHVVLVEEYPLQGMTAARLWSIVKGLTGLAQRWKTEYFLLPEDTEHPGPSMNHPLHSQHFNAYV
jgi:hypothetical protein